MQILRSLLLPGLLALAGCGDNAHLPTASGYGSKPQLPAPQKSLLPTVHIATAKGWPAGVTPKPAAGLSVKAFAAGLQHPRWLYVLPNGDVLVAETGAPPQPDEGTGLRGWIQGQVLKRAGSDTPSANRITLLRDSNGDGVADVRTALLSGLHSPFGMALVGNILYIAQTDALTAFPYQNGETHIAAPGRKLVTLPAGSRNHHWTKNVIASPDGTKLYVTVGSNSNAGENGMAAEEGRAAIWEIDPQSGAHRVYASGLRNPNGMGWSPAGRLWTAVNERDELGGDLVPDYMTSIRKDGFYGWPYSYYGRHVDDRVKPQNPALVAKAIAPDYALGAHTASLGLVFAGGAWGSGVFIGQHGSWNRKPLAGYRVAFVPFDGERPSGLPRDILTGFVSPDGVAYGRPVGVALDKASGLLVADDVGNVVWRVTK